MTGLPFLSVVIPCWNEAGFVAAFLDSVLANDYPPDRMEILLVDGMSDDGTREIVARYAEREPRLHLVDNPGHSKPVALNLGILEARGDVIIRLDVHAVYQNDYLRQCVQGLVAHPEADNVGGVRRAEPRDEKLLSRAISLANTHPWRPATRSTGSARPGPSGSTPSSAAATGGTSSTGSACSTSASTAPRTWSSTSGCGPPAGRSC
ncbi:glycosyltransferase [Paractinoplanes durhamensis]|uniref:glycosyltransferase n=1 Tax=Paractinoplanes durhamensis TaxID=113563 RepID=UPI0036402E74